MKTVHATTLDIDISIARRFEHDSKNTDPLPVDDEVIDVFELYNQVKAVGIFYSDLVNRLSELGVVDEILSALNKKQLKLTYNNKDFIINLSLWFSATDFDDSADTSDKNFISLIEVNETPALDLDDAIDITTKLIRSDSFD